MKPIRTLAASLAVLAFSASAAFPLQARAETVVLQCRGVDRDGHRQEDRSIEVNLGASIVHNGSASLPALVEDRYIYYTNHTTLWRLDRFSMELHNINTSYMRRIFAENQIMESMRRFRELTSSESTVAEREAFVRAALEERSDVYPLHWQCSRIERGL